MKKVNFLTAQQIIRSAVVRRLNNHSVLKTALLQFSKVQGKRWNFGLNFRVGVLKLLLSFYLQEFQNSVNKLNHKTPNCKRQRIEAKINAKQIHSILNCFHETSGDFLVSSKHKYSSRLEVQKNNYSFKCFIICWHDSFLK